jgi:uracil-DNA glycosylase
MKVKIAENWKELLKIELEKDYFKDLIEFVDDEYANNLCFPPEEQIFEAFNQCEFENVKVVIIGQDPYHGEGQAHGLCFSVNEGINHPPSLKNIFKEMGTDLGIDYPKNGNLLKWANQGVLLLNATLTVRAHNAGSHQKKGWEKFTDAVISLISEKKENVIFLLWGGYAKKKGLKVDKTKHTVLLSGHPSPLSANRGFWFGNKHFSNVNEMLLNLGLEKIEW